MKLTKYINWKSLALMVAVGLTGCADELDVKTNEVADGFMELTIDIPEAQVVKTRVQAEGNEKAIKEMKLYFFSTDGSTLYSEETIDPSYINDNKVTIKLPEESKTNQMTLYTVVNGNSYLEGLTNPTISRIENKVADQDINLEDGLVMVGKTVNIGIKASSANVILNRIVSRVSMSFDSNLYDYELLGFDVINAAEGAYLGAGTNNEKWFFNSADNRVSAVAGLSCDTYLYPSKGKRSNANKPAYVIMKAKPYGNDNTYYYRLDLYNNDGYLDIEPNHEYQIHILAINHLGFSSADEAAKYPESDAVDYVIHDHAANVMTMVSDGIRELGVTREVQMMSDITSQITVKVFSRDANATEEMAVKPKLVVKEGSDWLKISNINSPELIERPDSETSGNQDRDDFGTRWKYNLALQDDAKIYSDKTAVIEVSWMGLTRTVNVKYEAAFNPEEACAVKLTYNTGSSTTIEADYWSFLKNTVKGADKNSMADGKIRNEGLHFPMPYGQGTKWTYSYEFDFSKSNSGNNPIQSVNISTSGDNFFNISNLNWSYSPTTLKGTLSLKSPQPNDYTYATGILMITIKYSDGGERLMTLDLYHTGFFHKDTKWADGCLYYEVVNLGGKYWLDRNVGATSNMMFVDNAEGTVGNSGARGSFYKIANPGSNFGDPTAQYSELCPPGYVIPNSTDWDAVRFSPDFVSTSTKDGELVSTAYRSMNGNVYFPKGRFYNQPNKLDNGPQKTEEVNSGDAGAGYYWTTTIASGLEKDEIGNWYRALNLNGSSNTYINGSINYHMMNVRCIASASHASENKYSIGFNVKGATHVYLYSLDQNNNKSGVFAFPGKAIGSQSAVDKLNYAADADGSYLHFSYTSTIPETNLKVFFAYVKDDGEIIVISENGSQNIDTATGWDVKVGYNYFFNKNNNFAPIYKNNQFPWLGTGSSDSGGNTGSSFNSGDVLRVMWYKEWYGKFYKYLHVWYPNGGDIIYGLDQATKEGYDDSWYYDIRIDQNGYNAIMIILSEDNNWKNQTSDMTINYSDVNSANSQERADGVTYTYRIPLPQ